jgi:hypothetical protein
MPVKSSGQLSFSEIVAEFSDTAPHSMSEFYRGGGKIPTNNTNIPTSGAISFSNFYNAVNRVSIVITIASDTTNYVLSPSVVPGYVSGASDITLTINSDVFVYSTSTSNAGLTVRDFSITDNILIINNGYIMGKGGDGGGGRQNGQAGGPALSVFNSIRLSTAQGGYAGLYGGGGGGAGGGGLYQNSISGFNASGGGGGAGGGAGGVTNFGGAGGNPRSFGSNGTTSLGDSGTQASRVQLNVGFAKIVGGGGGGRVVGPSLQNTPFEYWNAEVERFNTSTPALIPKSSFLGGSGGGRGAANYGMQDFRISTLHGTFQPTAGSYGQGAAYGNGGNPLPDGLGPINSRVLPRDRYYINCNIAAAGGGGGYGGAGGNALGANGFDQPSAGATWIRQIYRESLQTIAIGGTGGNSIQLNGNSVQLLNTPPIMAGAIS